MHIICVAENGRGQCSNAQANGPRGVALQFDDFVCALDHLRMQLVPFVDIVGDANVRVQFAQADAGHVHARPQRHCFDRNVQRETPRARLADIPWRNWTISPIAYHLCRRARRWSSRGTRSVRCSSAATAKSGNAKSPNWCPSRWPGSSAGRSASRQRTLECRRDSRQSTEWCRDCAPPISGWCPWRCPCCAGPDPGGFRRVVAVRQPSQCTSASWRWPHSLHSNEPRMSISRWVVVVLHRSRALTTRKALLTGAGLDLGVFYERRTVLQVHELALKLLRIHIHQRQITRNVLFCEWRKISADESMCLEK